MSERVVTATEAHVNFGELMQVVAEQNQTVFIARGGKPYVVMLSMEEYTLLRKGSEIKNDWEAMVESVRARIATEAGTKVLPSAVELIRQGREARSGELADLY